MVFESINKTSLNVKPKVWLSDKFYFTIFIHVDVCFVVIINIQHGGEFKIGEAKPLWE